MGERTDRLFDEVDRQLEEVREQVAAVTTRAGLLITTAGVAAAVLAARIQRAAGDYAAALWPLGLALALALIAIGPTLTIGPNQVSLTNWRKDDKSNKKDIADSRAAQKEADTKAISELYMAKLLTLGVNRQRLVIMTCAFYLECAAVVASIVTALIVAAGR